MAPSSAAVRDSLVTFLCGGACRCDPSWDKSADAIDQCYKLYFVRDGEAHVALTGEADVAIRAGQAYFIPGYQLVRQWCRKSLDVAWLHFVPDSLYLSFLMSHVPGVHAWPLASFAYWEPIYGDIERLFADRAIWLDYRVQALVLDMVSRVLQQYNFTHMGAVDPIFEQLQPAIAYMDAHLADNPRLAEIARIVHLAPNYFHQKFTRTFQMTPLAYMLQKRLHLARQLLLGTDLTLEKIALRSGFQSPFYLSRMFKKRYHICPSEFRRRAGP
jgi:AraC-like DNA-binding protein